MITTEKCFRVPESYPLSRIGRPEKLLFFDIETTGFSGDRGQVYLIGCVHPLMDGNWKLLQWFADTAGAEAEVLSAFFSYLEHFRTLVHFNGDGFDIPFLTKRCIKLGLACGFSGVESFDIYKRIRPWKKLLGLENLKQKAIENFLGIDREDRYNGGQLIQVYQDYLRSQDPRLYHLLMLHNEEDIKGMPSILPVLSYPDFFQQDFSLAGQEITGEAHLSGDVQHCLSLRCENAGVFLPVPVSFAHSPFSLNAAGTGLTLKIELYEGELKHFYENYKDYYYLIYEDNAIHKSVGEYVDREARTAANRNNCYTRRSGCFLPECSPVWEPVLKKDRKDKLDYCELANAHPGNAEELSRYLCQIFAWLGVPGAGSDQIKETLSSKP